MPFYAKKSESDNNIQPGTWIFWGLTVGLKCPYCEMFYRLNHDINNDGIVSPSVECPTEDCTFHEHVTLLDYNPEDRPKKNQLRSYK